MKRITCIVALFMLMCSNINLFAQATEDKVIDKVIEIAQQDNQTMDHQYYL